MISSSLFILLLIGTAAALDYESGPYTYIESLGASYRYYGSYFYFRQGVLLCLSQGAQLFYPRSVTEAREVYNKIIPLNVSEIWMGVHNEIKEMGFITVDGDTNYYSNWQSGEPHKYHDYALLTRDLKLTTERRRHYNFVCKKSTKIVRSVGGYVDNEQYGSSLKYHTTPRHFTQSILMCLSEGAELYYPKSRQEARAVYDTIVPSDINVIWLGIHNYLERGFITINGKTNYYSNWKPGEPGDRSIETVLHRNMAFTTEDWYSRPKNFICRKGQVPKIGKICQFQDLGFVYQPTHSKMFKFHNEPLSWYDANTKCLNENSYLAMPNNQDELELVAKQAEVQCVGYEKLWIGFSNHQGIEEYVNMNDDPVETVKYNWVFKDDGKYSKGCGALLKERQLGVYECNVKQPFVCEMIVTPNFLYHAELKKSYEVSPWALSWSDARTFCRNQRSILAMPINPNERSVIIDKISSLSTSMIHVGAHNYQPNGVVALKGSTPISETFAKNSTDPKLACGAMQQDGKLWLSECNTVRYFICESEGNLESEMSRSSGIVINLPKEGAKVLHYHWVVSYPLEAPVLN